MSDLEIAIMIAKKAGQFLKEHQATAQHIDTGDRNDVFMTADQGSDQMIVDLLAKHFPHDGIITEHRRFHPERPRGWRIDPLMVQPITQKDLTIMPYL